MQTIVWIYAPTPIPFENIVFKLKWFQYMRWLRHFMLSNALLWRWKYFHLKIHHYNKDAPCKQRHSYNPVQ